MMTMEQEVTPRRPHSARVGDSDDADELMDKETDPMVSAAPNSSARRAQQAESWVQFVLDRIWSLAFLGVASLGLYEAEFVPELLQAPHARREFVHLGVLFASLLGLFGAYIEVYRGMILGERVHYATAKTATHGMLASMLASGFWYIDYQFSA